MLLGASLRSLLNARAMDVSVVDTNGDQLAGFDASRPASATLTNVAISTTTAVLLPANAARRKFHIHNAASKDLYVAFDATATTSAFTFVVPSNSHYESDINDYTGVISGILIAGSGSARITEITT